jgi:hypothetical protein
MRQLFAALALGLIVATSPAVAAPTTNYQVAAAPKKDDKAPKKDDKAKKPDTKKGNVLTNLLGNKVAFNPQTKKYHVKGCRYYDGKTNVMMSAADAKKKGGQPCQICQKGKK